MPAARDLLKRITSIPAVLAWGYRAARAASSRLPWRLAVFAALALCASWPLLSTAPALNEFRDAHVLAHYETAAREALLRWHQMPLWDPYYCGGMYLLGTPQARFVSPTFLLTLIFGEQRAEALSVFAMMLVGLEGAYRYARSRGARGFGALLAAPLFALGGIFAVSPGLGWIGFFSFELLPWIALGVRRALARELRGVVIAAVAMAWCIGMGGTYPAPIAAAWCLFEVIDFLVRRARRGRGAQVAIGLSLVAAAALLAAGLAAVRLWPIADTLASAPRVIAGTAGNSLGKQLGMLFLGPQDKTENGSFYLGALALPAVILGLWRRRSLPVVIAASLCVWFAGGYAMEPSLFGLLRDLPIYSSLRYPERFLVPFALAATVLAARGISSVEAGVRARRRRSKGRPGRVRQGMLAIASLALVANVVPMALQHARHDGDRPLSPPPDESEARPFHQSRGNRWGLAYYEPMQRGSLSCWEAYPVPQSPLLRGDMKDEEWLDDAGAGKLVERAWSPDRIELEADLTRPATVLVNQNWHSGWRASVGDVASRHGLLTVAMPAGQNTLTLRFAPKSATGGELTSLVALVALGLLVWRAKRRPTVEAFDLRWISVVLLPAIPAALVATTVHEPRFNEPLMAMDGRPVVVDELDEGTVRMDARFEAGVVLEAATLSDASPRPGTDLKLELDWRRDAQIEKGLGVFVHITPMSGDGMNGDHVLLSGVLDFGDAPPGKTLRDVLPLWVPDDARGKSWKVWVGLWRVRQGGERVPLTDPGHAEVDANRVLAASYVVR
ncbi:MAG TPA: hypothetical protein VF765_12860 [Polyangiaceae bacterium]